MKNNLKDILRVVICVIGIFLCAGVCQAEEPVSNIHYTLSGDGTLTISGRGAVADKQEMDKYKENTKQLIIEEGITDLQNVDLWSFTKMETVRLPSSIKVIHDEVFAGCRSLKEVDMPDVSYIGVKAFWKCKSLKNIINAKAVEEIGNDAFKECYSLKWPTFGTGLKKIGESAFFECVSLKNVVIPDSVTEIRRVAFCYCESLEKIVLPASLKRWRKSVTDCCPKLRTIVNRSRLSCQINDFDGYRIWKTDGKRVKNVPAKKTAVARGKKLKIIYELEGGQRTGKLPKYYEYGTILRIPQTVKKKGCVMAGWFIYDDKRNDEDGIYESVDRRSYLGPVARKPILSPIWLEYSAENTKKGTVVLKVGDPEYPYDDGGCYKYLVRYSLNKNMKSAKKRYITGYPAKTMFRKLKKGKTYYFQVGPIYDIEEEDPDFWLKKHKIKITK